MFLIVNIVNIQSSIKKNRKMNSFVFVGLVIFAIMSDTFLMYFYYVTLLTIMSVISLFRYLPKVLIRQTKK